MASLTIRKLDPAIKEGLRLRAAQHGHSMEEEARRILHDVCGPGQRPTNAFDSLREISSTPEAWSWSCHHGGQGVSHRISPDLTAGCTSSTPTSSRRS